MSTKILIGIFAFLFAASCGLGGFSYYLYDRISVLNTDLTAFETDTANQFTVVHNDINSLDSSLNAFKTDTANKFTNVDSKITTLNTAFTNFQTQTTEQFSAIGNNITGLNTRLTELAARFAESTVSGRQVYDDVIGSVCLVTDGGSLGSGFVYRADGYIVTCWHVITNMSHIDVLLHDGSVVRAIVVGSDQYSDVAVLKLTGKTGLTPLVLADSDYINSGDPVMVVGNPLGIFETVTYGIVSRTNGMVNPQGRTWYVANLIQFDAPSNPGNSGGPVISGKGQVVGIAAYSSSPAEGIHYAVSSNKIQRIAQAIIDNGIFTNATLPGDWNLEDLTPDEAITKGLDSAFGVVFTRAQSMGELQINDVAIMVDDVIIKDGADLFSYIGEYKSAGDTIVLTVISSGFIHKEISLTLVEGWVFVS